MVMIRVILATFFVCCSLSTFGQQPIQDNLNQTLPSTEPITDEVHRLLESAEIEYERNFSKAKAQLSKVFQLLQTPTDSIGQQQLAKALVIQGVVLRREAKFPEAVASYLQAKSIYDSNGDAWNSSDVLHNIGMVYRYQNNHVKALEHYRKAIAIKLPLEDFQGVAAGYNMMGVSFRQSKELDSAKIYYDKARTLFQKLSSYDDVRRVNNNLVALFLNLKNYEEAERIALENLQHAKQHGKLYSLCVAYRNASNVYKGKKDYLQSLQYIDSSLIVAKNQQFRDLIAKGYLRRSYLFAKLNNYKKAYYEYRIFNRHSDSIFNIENVKKVQELELNYKFEQEKREMELIAAAEASQKWLYFVLLLVISGGGIVIGFLVYVNNKIKTKAYKAKLAQEQLQKELLDAKVRNTEEEANRLIADNTMRLVFKQELVEQLKSKLNQDTVEGLKKSLNSVLTELQLQISTEIKHSSLQNKITEANKGFDKLLREKYPKLSKTEREICALLRLNLSIKEIMTVRNASLDAVKSTRYRIRKKMGLKTGEELEKFIQNLR